jgi:hypothetical protein
VANLLEGRKPSAEPPKEAPRNLIAEARASEPQQYSEWDKFKNALKGHFTSLGKSVAGAYGTIEDLASEGFGAESGSLDKEDLSPETPKLDAVVGEAGKLIQHPVAEGSELVSRGVKSVSGKLSDPTGRGTGELGEAVGEMAVPGLDMAGRVGKIGKAAATAGRKLLGTEAAAAGKELVGSQGKAAEEAAAAERSVEAGKKAGLEAQATAAGKGQGKDGPLRRYVSELKEKKAGLEKRRAEFSQRAAQEAGLPEPHQVRGAQPGQSVGDDIRTTAERAQAEAMQIQAEDTSFNDYLEHAKQLEETGSPFAGSEPGIELLKRLEKIEEQVDTKGFTSKSEAIARAAGKLKDVILGAETEMAPAVAGKPLDFGALLEDPTAALEGAGGKAAVRGNAPARFRLLDEELRKIRKKQYDRLAEGASDITRREWKELGDALEEHMKKYVGEDKWPREAYAKASERINKFQTDLAQKLTGKQDLEYVKPGTEPPKTDVTALANSAFKSDASAAEFRELVGEESFNRIATQHMSNELHGMSAEDVAKWRSKPENVWHKMVPGGEGMALNYQESVARAAHDIKSMEAAIKDKAKYIADTKAVIKSNVKAIRKDAEKARGAIAERQAGQNKEAMAAHSARLKVAEKLADVLIGEKPATRVGRLEDILRDSDVKLSPEQIDTIRQRLSAVDKQASFAGKVKAMKEATLEVAKWSGVVYLGDKAIDSLKMGK